MATHENEIVTVSLQDGTKRNGVVYTIDPEQGWVTVIADIDGDGKRRLMIVRRECVTFTSAISSFSSEGIATALDGYLLKDKSTISGAELVKALRARRIMDAALDAESGKVSLLDGTVEIGAPYGADQVACTNETIAARVAAMLDEIKGDAGLQP